MSSSLKAVLICAHSLEMTALSSAAVLQARTFRMRSLRNARTVFSQSSGLVCGRVIPLDSYARRILVAMMIGGAGIPRESSQLLSLLFLEGQERPLKIRGGC
eukprot:COSAG05_NODE_125_length_17331_cov_16.188058_11_plen_102_part_00